jgi:hypothetical protein
MLLNEFQQQGKPLVISDETGKEKLDGTQV